MLENLIKSFPKHTQELNNNVTMPLIANEKMSSFILPIAIWGSFLIGCDGCRNPVFYPDSDTKTNPNANANPNANVNANPNANSNPNANTNPNANPNPNTNTNANHNANANPSANANTNANPNANTNPNNNSNTPLITQAMLDRVQAEIDNHELCYRPLLDVLKELMQGDTKNINTKDQGYGRTPLHLAGMLGDLNIVKAIVEQGANINQQNSTGASPLLYATNHENEDVIDYLLSKGADKNIPTLTRETPYLYAKLNHDSHPNQKTKRILDKLRPN